MFHLRSHCRVLELPVLNNSKYPKCKLNVWNMPCLLESHLGVAPRMCNVQICRSKSDCKIEEFDDYRRELVDSTQITSRSNTFVSSYYKIDESVFESYLDRKKFVYKKVYPNKFVIQECPFCHDTKGLSNNQWKLYIYADNGKYYCFRCNSKGSWFDFQRRLGGVQYGVNNPVLTMKSHGNIKSAPSIPLVQKLSKYLENLENLPQAKDYLYNTRKLSPEVIAKYQVGACVLRIKNSNHSEPESYTDHVCVVFPWIELNAAEKTSVVRFKIRSISDKSIQRLEPVGGKWGWFGFHLIPADSESVIITEGEFDAMAVYQATGLPAISLPTGVNCLPVELIEKLENFSKIYLWMDNDVVGQQASKKFAKKLGQERCYIVQPTFLDSNLPKDANDALRQGLDITEILQKAQVLPHKQIALFSDLKNDIYRELIHPDQVEGIKSTSFPTLNKILKGHRRGELTIYSGPTGIGKTTVMSQLSLDYLVQDVPTLWGSFELHNTRLAKKIMTQFFQKDLSENIEQFQEMADEFSKFPLYFLKFHGSTDVDGVIDAMEYATYVHDVVHIIIDNLQFMTLSANVRGFDKFEIMDNAISKFRMFATTKNVHISLIIHPRKEDFGHVLSTSSIFGSAKATQEADNVVIIQQGKHYRYLEVTKNRFSGDLGKIPYKFVSSTGRYVELEMDEIKNIHNTNPSTRASEYPSLIQYTRSNTKSSTIGSRQ